MIEIKPPSKIYIPKGYKSVFIAGSIENGKAKDFQKIITESFVNEPIVFLNPRRDDWDPSSLNDITNDVFRWQVQWELDGLEIGDIIVMFFEPDTKSPISLLELGLYAKSNKLVVCCPNGFWRKGNVDIVAHRYGIKQVETIE